MEPRHHVPMAASTFTRTALAALALMSLTLGGCAPMTPAPEPATPAQIAAWEDHRDQVEPLNDWAFAGRAAVKSGLAGGSVGVDWTQVGRVTSLTMNGPFDTGRLALTGTSDHMLITDGDGNRHLTRRPVEYLAEQTGWHIPLAALPRWLRGLPVTSLADLPAQRYELDASGRLVRLEETGWTIEYARYAPEGTDRLALPHFLELRQEGMRIRIVIDSWDLGDARR